MSVTAPPSVAPPSPAAPPARPRSLIRGPAWRNVWLLALASLIADVSGEMLQAVLPFLLVAQGAGGIGIGLTGGLTEGFGQAMKVVGGYAGARVKRKKLLVASGYLVAAVSRFGVAGAQVWSHSLAFRMLDRTGKGLREAPRDTLLADSIPKAQRGRAFGLHRAGDTLGAVIGVSIAIAILWHFFATSPPAVAQDPLALKGVESNIVFIGALIGLLAVVPVLLVRERPDGAESPALPLEPLSPRYGTYLAVAGLAYLGHVSYLFFILRASQVPGDGVPSMVGAVLWYLVFNVVYVAASYPAGILTDRVGRVRVLVIGFGLAALANALFFVAPSPWTIGAGFVALGASYAATEGTGRTLAADLAGTTGRSIRLGWYQFVVGVATVLGGVAAGYLWETRGPHWAFAWGAAVSVAAGVALALWAPLRRGKAAIRTPTPGEES